MDLVEKHTESAIGFGRESTIFCMDNRLWEVAVMVGASEAEDWLENRGLGFGSRFFMIKIEYTMLQLVAVERVKDTQNSLEAVCNH